MRLALRLLADQLKSGTEVAPLHLLPTLWFRNTWAWGYDDRRPVLTAVEAEPGRTREQFPLHFISPPVHAMQAWEQWGHDEAHLDLPHVFLSGGQFQPMFDEARQDEALGHNHLFEATARLVQIWAARRPLVLFLDDMQSADTATLDLVLYLARRLAEQPVPILLLLNLRTGADTFPDLQSTWLMALKQTRIPLTALVLTPFTKVETQRFVQALAWAKQAGNHDGKFVSIS